MPHTQNHPPHPPQPDPLTDLFRNHAAQVFQTAYRVTGSEADAEDVQQTVFLRLMRLTDLPQPEGAADYLYRAAVNAGLDVVRKRARFRLVSVDDLSGEPSDLRGAPDRGERGREVRRELRKAVADLGDTAGTVFALRYFEGLDNARIAAVMGSTRAVVAVTLHRARARVQKHLQGLKGGMQ